MTATLLEQMGAMSVIDGLRHRKMVVKELLNLPARREEVSQRIQDYYRSKNIDVAPELVDQGVRQYFSKRLSFEAPRPSPVAALLARVYIARTRWIRPAIVVVTGLAIASASGIAIFNHFDAAKTERVQAAALSTIANLKQLDEDIARQLQTVSSIANSLAQDPIASASRLLQGVSDELTLLTRSDNAPIPGVVTAASRDADSVHIAAQQERLQNAQVTLQAVRAQIVDIRTLIDANSRLRNAFSSPAFAAAVSHSPQLDAASRAAVTAIDQADTDGVKPASAAVSKVLAVLDGIARMDGYSKQQESLLRKFRDMHLAAADETTVNALSSSLTAAIEQLDTQKADTALREMQQLLRFAETPLTLNIVDRTGVKSGVERTYDKSGGRSWFVVVEAVNPAGQVVPVMVTSAETGKRQLANAFAVRVSQAEYERVKADKKSDGHIDDRLMGQKPTNSLKLRFNQRTAETPDMITEW